MFVANVDFIDKIQDQTRENLLLKNHYDEKTCMWCFRNLNSGGEGLRKRKRRSQHLKARFDLYVYGIAKAMPPIRGTQFL